MSLVIVLGSSAKASEQNTQKELQSFWGPRYQAPAASRAQAEEENGQSRIYLGIHWDFDTTEGIAQGRFVADHVVDHIFTPVNSDHGVD